MTMMTVRTRLGARLERLTREFVEAIVGALGSASVNEFVGSSRFSAPSPRGHDDAHSEARPHRERSVNERIVALLDEQPGDALRAAEIAAALGRPEKVRSISAALSALAARGLVARPSAGTYASRRAPGPRRRPERSANPEVVETRAPAAVDPPQAVVNPQLLLDALESSKPASSAASMAARARPVRRGRPAPRPVVVAPAEVVVPAAPPPLREDETAQRTSTAGFVIRRRRAAAAA